MRSRRLLTALVLALVALGLAVPAQAASTGTLHVVMLDEHGDPMPGQIQAFTADGGIVPAGSSGTSTWTIDLAPGEYGLVTMSPWGGLLCAGLEHECSLLTIVGGPVELDGSVAVASGQTTEVVITGTKPVSVHGPARVGKKLVVDWSRGMENLLDYLGRVGGGFYAPVVQWLRDGKPIRGATDDSYRPVGADAGRKLAVRVEYPPTIRPEFEQMTGAPVRPRTSNAVEVEKVKTQSFATLGDATIPAGREGRVRVDVTASQQIVTGKVRVRIGEWSRIRSLRNGNARFVLPALRAGKYTVSASYLGSKVYEPSKAKPKTLTVG